MWFFIQRARSGCRGRLARWLGAMACACAAGAPGWAQLKDGDGKWEFAIGNGFIQSSPAVGLDGTIYVGVNTRTNPARGFLFAVNPNGTNKWGHLPDGAFRT